MKMPLLYVASMFASGCAVPEATRYLSEPTPDEHLSLVRHTNQEEVRICNEILARDPRNRFALANRDFFQRKIDADEAAKAAYQNWWASLGTERRVQFDDWVRYYVLSYWHLGIPREDAVYKATQLYGKPAIPPLVPTFLGDETQDAVATIRAAFGR